MNKELRKPATARLLLIAVIVVAQPLSESRGQSIKEKLLAGEEISFGFEENRQVPAAWIQEAIARHARVNVSNAVITGKLTLQYAVCEQEIALRACEFREPPDFSYAVFKRKLILSDSTFENGASFESATMESDIRLDNARFVEGAANFSATNFGKPASFIHCQFEDEARFDNAHFRSLADFREATFLRGVNLHGTDIGGPAYFGYAIFKQSADCIDLHIAGSADFKGATFNQDAIFNAVRIDQYVYLGATFEGRAVFTGIQIGSMLNCQDAVFKSDAVFNLARVGWHAVFGWTPDNKSRPAIFEGETDFIGMLVGDQANFVGVVFKKKVTFDGARFNRDAIFRSHDDGRVPATVFEGEAKFIGTRFVGEADFQDAVFKGNVSFNRAEFGTLARFGKTLFGDASSFQETNFRVVEFSPDGRAGKEAQFQGALDLRGCTYERIQANWPMMVKKIEPYDRRPFTQLEKVLRATGDDDAANAVYLERQRIERHRKWQNHDYEGWLASAAYGLLANYGVRPFRLIGVSIALLALGTIFFRQRDTVSKGEQNNDEPAHLSFGEAFAVSLHNFLPVTVPMGSEWKPRPEPVAIKIPFTNRKLFQIRPATFATFVLRIAGWILVPLGVAALSGLLRVSP